MPCWSGNLKVVAKVVLLGEWAMGVRGRRWKGDSMLNSSWRASVAGSLKGR
jgi:hypothetical protein